MFNFLSQINPPFSSLQEATTSAIISTERIFPALRNIVDIIANPALQDRLFIIKIVFIIFSAIFLFGILYMLKSTDVLQAYFFYDFEEIKKFKKGEQKKLERKWQQIKKRLLKDEDVHYKLALVEAYNLVDNVLQRMGFNEKTLPEKIAKFSLNERKDLSYLQNANRVCQDIIHDQNYKLSKESAQESVLAFEKFLTDLEIF